MRHLGGKVMLLPWLLPLVIIVGILSTQSAIEYRKLHPGAKRPGDAWLLIILGWIPLFAWIVNYIWPQN